MNQIAVFPPFPSSTAEAKEYVRARFISETDAENAIFQMTQAAAEASRAGRSFTRTFCATAYALAQGAL